MIVLTGKHLKSIHHSLFFNGLLVNIKEFNRFWKYKILKILKIYLAVGYFLFDQWTDKWNTSGELSRSKKCSSFKRLSVMIILCFVFSLWRWFLQQKYFICIVDERLPPCADTKHISKIICSQRAREGYNRDGRFKWFNMKSYKILIATKFTSSQTVTSRLKRFICYRSKTTYGASFKPLSKWVI